MKKYLLLIFTALLLGNVCAEQGPENNSYWSKAKDWWQERREYMAAAFWTSSLGDLDVKEEIDREIRAILKEIGLENVNEIRIKRLSKLIQYNGVGEKNAIATGLIGLPRYIFVNEEWWVTLTPEKKRFLIGHEGMHLKCNHGDKKMGLSIACVTLASFALLKAELDSFRAPGLFDEDVALPHFYRHLCVGALVAGMVVIPWFSKRCEYEADAEAVKALGCYEGAYAFFDEMCEYKEALYAELSQRPEFVEARRRAEEQVLTHPTHAQRIAQIQALEQKLKNEQLALLNNE